MSQLIISVGREFGSGGRVIAEALAKRFDIPLYDRHLITEIADKKGMSPEEIERDKKVQKAVLEIKNKFGKNAMLKGMNLMEGGTTIDRNGQIGGHKAGDDA